MAALKDAMERGFGARLSFWTADSQDEMVSNPARGFYQNIGTSWGYKTERTFTVGLIVRTVRRSDG